MTPSYCCCIAVLAHCTFEDGCKRLPTWFLSLKQPYQRQQDWKVIILLSPFTKSSSATAEWLPVSATRRRTRQRFWVKMAKPLIMHKITNFLFLFLLFCCFFLKFGYCNTGVWKIAPFGAEFKWPIEELQVLKVFLSLICSTESCHWQSFYWILPKSLSEASAKRCLCYGPIEHVH